MFDYHSLTRREMIRLSVGALGLAVGPPDEKKSEPPAAAPLTAPTAPVAVARCITYTKEEIGKSLAAMAEQIGGLKKLVNDKTVTIKINATGPAFPWAEQVPGETYKTHPLVVQGLVELLAGAGARRIRLVESAQWTGRLEEFLSRDRWDIPALQAAAPKLEFENTRNLGLGKAYARLKVPGGGLMFPSYDLNHSYVDTDIFVSLAKLKAHLIAGVTMSMKNLFGLTPNTIYGDDAGTEEATSSRIRILHEGAQKVPGGVPTAIAGEGKPPEWRVPRIIADLVAARPIDLCVIDGILSVAGAEGPWSFPLRPMAPHLLIMGRNPVCTDAVGATIMGYSPEATSGPPYLGDNHLALAAALGIGTNIVSQIEVRGLSLKEARCPYGVVNSLRA